MKALCLFIILISLFLALIIHECGHFIAARLIKLPVTQFQIGMGKPIIKKKVNDTEYAFSPLLFGAFVANKTKDMEKLSYTKQCIFFHAGGLANFLFAYILAIIACLFAGHGIHSFAMAFRMLGNILNTMIQLIRMLFAGAVNFSDKTGIIGSFSKIGDMVASSDRNTLGQISVSLGVSAYLSIALGIGNLLPIPSLDGGQIITEGIIRIGRRFHKNLRPAITKISNVFCLLFMILTLLMFIPDLL